MGSHHAAISISPLAAMPTTVGGWLGWASVGLLALTVLFVLCTLVASRAARGWDKLGYVVVAAIGSWVGCGVGVIVGIVALLVQGHGNWPASVGVLVNLLAGGGPYLAFQMKKARERRERSV